MFELLRRRQGIEHSATSHTQDSAEMAQLRVEVDALGQRIATIERLLRFVHGDGCLGGSEPPPQQPPPQPELRLKPLAVLRGRFLVMTE